MPYAAKAVIQHEFQTNHLNVWITFRHPMDELVMPSLSKWMPVLDDVSKDVTSSEWLDEFTLLLEIAAVAARPIRVTLAYDGPDPYLHTTWGKDWEPWGPILSTDLTATLFFTGAILLWYGLIATIPSGWRLCDGTNGTPDLRDKFVVGARQDVTGVAKTYVTGEWSKTGGNVVHTHPGDTITTAYGSDFNAITVIDENWHLPPYYALAFIMKV